MRELLLAAFSICSALSQNISATNAASGSRYVAPRSLLSIFWFAPDIDGLSAALDVTIQARGSDQILHPRLLPTALPNHFFAIVPESLPSGKADVTVIVNSSPLPAQPLSVVPVSIGLFTASGSGIGPAIAQNISKSGAAELNRLTRPALPGQYVTLWATGLGTPTASDVIVSAGGHEIAASFAGSAPGLPGMDQINFLLPPDAPAGCYTPVSVRAGSNISNEVTIATAGTSGPCQHPLNLSAAEMTALDDGDTLLVGSLLFGSATLPTPNSDPAAYLRYEYFQADFRPNDPLDIFFLSPRGSTSAACRLVAAELGVYRLITVTPENTAGDSLTLTDPARQPLDVPLQAAWYSISRTSDPVTNIADLPAPFLVSGLWRVKAPGGAVVGGFEQSYTLPPQIRLTNLDALQTVGRDFDVPVAWNPEGYAPGDVMNLTLGASLGRAVSCSAPALAGQIVVPKDLVRDIDPGATYLLLSLAPPSPASFDLPAAGGGAIHGVARYSFIQQTPIAVQ